MKHLYELVPAGLKKRIKEDRRKCWDEKQAACVATAWTDLGKASKAVDSSKTKDAEAKLRLKKMKEEHQTRTELLKDMTAKYEDTGEGPSPKSSCVQRDRFGSRSILECVSEWPVTREQHQPCFQLLMDMVLRYIDIWAWHWLIFHASHRPGSCIQMTADASSPSFCMLPYLVHECKCQKAAGDALTTSTLGCYAQATLVH